jgi:hypothetical protein
METLHPHRVHADLRYLDMEASPGRGEDFQFAGLNGRLTCEWIGKVENSTPGHVRPPEAEKSLAMYRLVATSRLVIDVRTRAIPRAMASLKTVIFYSKHGVGSMHGL